MMVVQHLKNWNGENKMSEATKMPLGGWIFILVVKKRAWININVVNGCISLIIKNLPHTYVKKQL